MLTLVLFRRMALDRQKFYFLSHVEFALGFVMSYKPVSFRAIYRFNEVHVTESNRYELDFINHRLISKSAKTAIREIGNRTGKIISFLYF